MSQTDSHAPRRWSSALLLLAFPLIGVLVALAVVATSTPTPGTPATSVFGRTELDAPTPPAVTQMLLPTPISLAAVPLIDFELPRLNGGQARLSDYAGQIVFLNFWQTTCEPCKRELPAFQQFMRDQAADARAVIISVNVEESADAVRAFLTQQGVTDLTVLLDAQHVAADRYGVLQIPVTFVIDRSGLIRQPHYGEMRVEDLNAYVAAIGPGEAGITDDAGIMGDATATSDG